MEHTHQANDKKRAETIKEVTKTCTYWNGKRVNIGKDMRFIERKDITTKQDTSKTCTKLYQF